MKWELSGKISSETKLSPKWKLPLTLILGLTVAGAGFMVKAQMDKPKLKEASRLHQVNQEAISDSGKVIAFLKERMALLDDQVNSFKPDTVVLRLPGRVVRDTMVLRETVVRIDTVIQFVTVVDTVETIQLVRGKPSKFPWIITGLALGFTAWRELIQYGPQEKPYAD